MKNLLRIEEAMQFVLAVYLFNQLPYSWWIYAAFFLAPDLSMLGYAFGTRIGAHSYNFFHHKGIALLVYLVGVYASVNVVILTGLVLFGHSAFDRFLGYGLKFPDNFKNTHLGWLGNR